MDRQSVLQRKNTFHKRSLKIKVFIVALIFMLTVNVIPAVAGSKPNHESDNLRVQAASTLTFNPEADARVEQRNPTTNAGTSGYLAAVLATNRSIESYLRFTVSGTSG